MKIAKAVLLMTVGLSGAAVAGATDLYERVTGGVLDLPWYNGYGVSARMQPVTLAPGHPAYSNPSGDHTVASATNMPPDSGGIVLAAIEPIGTDDYLWEGWIFTGEGNTRRGLVVRADPTKNFESNYQFVIQAGLFQMNFRKLIQGSPPVTLGTWFTNTLPGGTPAPNTWHKMKVVAVDGNFQCYFDDFELTAGTPIIDNDLPTGYVGVYNFRFDLGGVEFLTDDLHLSDFITPTKSWSWGRVKALYRQ